MITKEDLEKISKLSKIDIKKTKTEEFTKQMSKIFDYIDKIKKYKFLSKKYISQESQNKLRDDVVINNNAEDIIREFNDKENNLLKVKKVL